MFKKITDKFALPINRIWLRYWYLLPLVGLLMLLAKLPYGILLHLGKRIGQLATLFPTSMRRVTTINIRRCFPQLSEKETRQLIHKSLVSAGMGMMELLLCWFRCYEPNLELIEIHPNYTAQLTAALAKGRGVILLCPHTNSLHIVGTLFAQLNSFDVVYNKIKHPLFEYINHQYLQKHYQHAYPREQIRQAIKALKKNHVLFYTPDIDPVGHGGVFAPFFGVNAYTLTATAKIASLTGAVIIPCYFFRREDGRGYTVATGAPLTNFPSGDAVADATLINATLEKIIKVHPEQYLWQYKRFKTRPFGENKFY